MKIDDPALRKETIVVCRSSEITSDPKVFEILGEKILIFRRENEIFAFQDLCMHRGVPLSLGCVKNDRLICAYHGFEYDFSGACVKIPQFDDAAKIPAKLRVIRYFCTERYGLVFVRLSEFSPDSDPKIPHFSPFFLPHARNILWETGAVKARYPRIIENFLDISHLAFIHENLLGTTTHPQINDFSVHTRDGRIFSDEIFIFQPDPDGSGVARDMIYTYEIFSPLCVNFIKTDPKTSGIFSIALLLSPVNTEISRAFGIISFDYEIQATDDEILAFQDKIFSQDLPIVQNQRPEDVPLSMHTELNLRFDKMAAAYRNLLRTRGLVFGVV